MEACVQDAKAWLCDNGLVMNDNKSQAIVIHSSSLRTPTSLTRVNICGQLVETSPVIRDLGFNVDTNLTVPSQVAKVCRSAYYHLSRIAKIRDSISITVCKSLIHALVTSWLDYGNAILYGISGRHMHRLEMVQRSAARIVRQIRRPWQQYCGSYTGYLSESESILNYLHLCTGPYTMARRSILRQIFIITIYTYYYLSYLFVLVSVQYNGF